MPIPPWFESIANTLEIPRKERENRYVRLNAELMEIGQRIARERYEEVGFRVTRVSQEKRKGGWDFLLVKIMPPAPFTLPDRICLKVRLDTTTIGGQGRECLVLVIAEGDHSWTETFMVCQSVSDRADEDESSPCGCECCIRCPLNSVHEHGCI